VQVGEQVVAAGGGVGIAWPVGAAIGVPWQSQVDVHVGKQTDVDAAIGRPAQSHDAEHVGEQRGATIGLPEQSHVDVHCGEHLAAATMGLPEQSQVDVHCGEHLPAARPDAVLGEPAPTKPPQEIRLPTHKADVPAWLPQVRFVPTASPNAQFGCVRESFHRR